MIIKEGRLKVIISKYITNLVTLCSNTLLHACDFDKLLITLTKLKVAIKTTRTV
jgi:hypothetical protein